MKLNCTVPSIILICGLPGTGKSSLARMLHNTLGWPVISTEIVRSQIYTYTATKQDIDFTEDELCVVYRAVCIISEFLLREKISVIVDGVFRSKEQRDLVLSASENVGARSIRILLTGDEKDILQRLKGRQEAGNVAPAGPLTFKVIKKDFEAVDSNFLTYNVTNFTLPTIMDAIVKEIESE